MIVNSDVRGGAVVGGGAVLRGLKLLLQLVCILQVVKGCIRPILTLPDMWCLCSAVLMCWRSSCRVILLVRLRLSRIGVVARGGRHLIRFRLSFFVKRCEWRAWGCDIWGPDRFWGVVVR